VIEVVYKKAQVHNRDRVVPYQTKDTSVIREIIHPDQSIARNQSLAEATVPPGATTEAHYHPQSEEIYYVLSGEGLLRIEDDESPVWAGNAVVIAPKARHQIRNIGAVDLVFLCCCAPAYAHDDTVLCDSLF
jgi:mannose-6-phosphate isomerase-like protein (cupin superfamily)